MIEDGELHPAPDELVAETMDAGVRAHLRACASCRIEQRRIRRWLEEKPPPESTQTDLPSDLTARIDRDLAAVLAATDRGLLSRYAIEDQQWIGNGDRGVVYEVFDRQQQRRVVLKVIPDIDAAHLRRVAEAIDTIGHPNLTRYHEIRGDRPLHVSRPLVDGAPLDVALERASRPKAIRLLGLVCSALCALHRAGFAHGGVTPSNVRVDPRGRVHVLDAGLAGPSATTRDDWRALATLVHAHARQLLDDPAAPPFSVSGMFGRMLDPDPDRCPDGVELLAALVLESGLGGLDATRYQIRSVLSEGGMGVLTRAWDPVLRREVALKQIKATRADSLDAVGRFLNEARIAAQLQHPNIVPVHELDWGPDARPFLTMKLIDGRHFGELVEELHNGGPTGLRDAIEVVTRLCDAVAFAHGKGVLHLDLKPSNVLVGAYGDVQLIDWGAARVVGRSVDIDDPDRSDKQELTRPYSPAEQQDAERADELEPRSDVFALGAVLLHVLTGARPPEDRPLPNVRTLAPAAPRELTSIVDRATRHDIADRYSDAGSLGRDLRAWLRQDRVAAHTYGPLELADLWTRGRRGWLGLALVSVLAIGTVGWFALLGWRTSAVNAERERERQGLVLAEQARLALIAGDRVEAERKAARAVALAGTPEGRGVLVRLGRQWYPRDAGPCDRSDDMVTCVVAAGTVRWRPGATAPTFAPEVPTPLPLVKVDPWTCGPLSLVRTTDGTGLGLTPDGDPVVRTNGDPWPVCGPTGRAFVVVTDDEANVWRTDPLNEDLLLGGHAGGVVAIAWSPVGARLATADAHGVVRLIETDAGREIARLSDHAEVEGLAFDPRGAVLLVAASPPRAWDVSETEAPDRIEARVAVIDVDWDHSSVTTLDRHGTWRSWSPDRGRVDGDDLGHVVFAASSPDGRAVAIVTDAAIEVHDRHPLRERWSAPRDGAAVLAWSDRELLTGGTDGRVRHLDALTGAMRSEEVVGVPIVGLVVAGDRVLALGADASARFVGGAGPWAEVNAVAAEPTSARFALGYADGTVRVGAARVGDDPPVVSLGSAVRALAFSPDGHTLGTISDDRTLRLFGENGVWSELARSVLEARSKPGLAFAPSGDVLAVAGSGSVVELWDTSVLRATDPEALVAERYENPAASESHP